MITVAYRFPSQSNAKNFADMMGPGCFPADPNTDIMPTMSRSGLEVAVSIDSEDQAFVDENASELGGVSIRPFNTVTYLFNEESKAATFFNLMAEFSSHAMDPSKPSDKEVSVTVPDEKFNLVTEIANELGGYVPAKPDFF